MLSLKNQIDERASLSSCLRLVHCFKCALVSPVEKKRKNKKTNQSKKSSSSNNNYDYALSSDVECAGGDGDGDGGDSDSRVFAIGRCTAAVLLSLFDGRDGRW